MYSASARALGILVFGAALIAASSSNQNVVGGPVDAATAVDTADTPDVPTRCHANVPARPAARSAMWASRP